MRKAGEEWLITPNIAEFHILDIYEQFVAEVNVTILNENQYTRVLDPVDEKGIN